MNYDIIISADNTIQNEDMYMIEYKHYDSSYETEVLKVFAESFVNYPLFLGSF